MKNKLNTSQGLNQKQRTISLVKGFSILTIAVFLFKTTGTSFFTNSQTIKVNVDKVNYYGTDFHNTESGTHTNLGQVYLTKNLTNDGTMTCGTCTSGTNYLQSSSSSIQLIDGARSITWHDGILDNAAGVFLKNELRLVNSFSFVKGQIKTDRKNKNQFLHFLEQAVVGSETNARHVNGYVGKTGGGSFTFPVGDGTRLLPVGVSGSGSSANFFKAACFSQNPSSAVLPNGPYDVRNFNKNTLLKVHDTQYWDVDGAAQTIITLHWDEKSFVDQLSDGIDSLVVVGWNGNTWESLGRSVYTGDLKKGTLSSDPVIPDEYDVYTLGKASDPFLSVKLFTFNVEKKGTDILLNWRMDSGPRPDYFQVEKSYDGNSFEQVGKVDAQGPGLRRVDFKFKDTYIDNPSRTRAYYRLRHVDQEGEFKFSKILAVNLSPLEDEEGQVKIFPIPADTEVDIQLLSDREIPLSGMPFQIVDKAGNLVYGGSLLNNGVKLDLGEWSDGEYYVNFLEGNANAQNNSFKVFHH